MRRSLLFLPGNTPNMLINGSCLGSDAVIFDLEDAVSPAEKDAARILVRNTMTYMDFRGCETIVRINGIDTPYWQEDLDEVLPCRPNLILLPKTEFTYLLIARKFKKFHERFVSFLIELRELHLIEPFMICCCNRRKKRMISGGKR